MKKYFYIYLGNKRFRIEIDEELDKKLRKSLKDDYKFKDNILELNKEEPSKTYLLKSKTIKNLLDLISTYELDPELEKKVYSLKGKVNLKRRIT